jgi:hypothetical protein
VLIKSTSALRVRRSADARAPTDASIISSAASTRASSAADRAARLGRARRRQRQPAARPRGLLPRVTQIPLRPGA